MFIINLPYRTDRKMAILKELRQMEIRNVEFFNGITIPSRQHLHKINPHFLKERPFWLKDKEEGYFQQYRLGALGCLLSHLGVMRQALRRGYKKILILEDDAAFGADRGSWKQICNAYRAQYSGPDPSFDILYLGGKHFKHGLRRLSQNLYQTKNTGNGYAYIISKEAMKYVVKNALGFGHEIDIFYIAMIQSQEKCFCILPPLFYQVDGFSDICQEKRTYDTTEVVVDHYDGPMSISNKIAQIDVQNRAAIMRDDFKNARRLTLAEAANQKVAAATKKRAMARAATAAQKASVVAANKAKAAAKAAKVAAAEAEMAEIKEQMTIAAAREEETKLEADKAKITDLLNTLGWEFSSKQLESSKRRAQPHS